MGLPQGGDRDLRPVFQRLENASACPRTDLHARLLPHLASAHSMRPLSFIDQDRAGRSNQAAPASRSADALPQLPRLARHLATLTRSQVRFVGSGTDVPMRTKPTAA